MAKYVNLPAEVRTALAQLCLNLEGAIARLHPQPNLVVIRVGGTIGMENQKKGGDRP